jgi:CRISPR-associated protein Cas2
VRYVVTYDVVSDRVRGRIARLLEGYGDRVQFSVFECDLENSDATQMVERLTRVLGDRSAGSIRVYRLCGDCLGASRVIGEGTAQGGAEACIIID